jgi:ABC-type uncharacterized transport system permease subunit
MKENFHQLFGILSILLGFSNIISAATWGAIRNMQEEGFYKNSKRPWLGLFFTILATLICACLWAIT